MMITTPVFHAFSREEDWSFRLEIIDSDGVAVDLSGRNYRINIKQKGVSSAFAVLDTADGTLSRSGNILAGRIHQSISGNWAAGEYSADVLGYVGDEIYRIIIMQVLHSSPGKSMNVAGRGSVKIIVSPDTLLSTGSHIIVYAGMPGTPGSLSEAQMQSAVEATASDRAAVNTAKTDTLAAKDAAVSAKDAAVSAKDAAVSAKDAAVTNATAAASDRAAAALSATNAAAAQVAAETARDGAVTAKNAADADATATAADRVQTGLDRTASSASASAAASSATNAATAKIASESARDLASGYKNTTQGLLDSVSALALQVAGNKTSAEAAATSASAVSGLSNLSATAKSIVAAADVAAVYIYDTTRDTDGGAWRDKCADKSWMTEALNTATRGATAKWPQRSLIVCRNSTNGNPAVSVYDLTDPACPMAMVFLAGAGYIIPAGVTYPITSVSALNGYIFVTFGNAAGAVIIDMIAETMIQWVAGGYWTYFGNISQRNTALPSAKTNLSTGLANNTVNSIAATVLPATQPNPLRCGLPTPTVAVGTAGGVSIFRADGVVVNSAATGGYTTVSFTNDFTLVASQGPSETDIYPLPKYLSPSFAIGSDFVAAFTIPAISAPGKAYAVGNQIAFARNGGVGLALMKRDKANPANSLTALVDDKSNTGWMHGAIKCALAESNYDLSNLSATTLFLDDFSSYADSAALNAAYNGAGAAVTLALVSGAMRVTRTAGGVSSVNSTALYTGVAGKTYCIEYDYSVGTFTGSLSIAVGLGVGLQGNAFALTSGASGHAVFYYTSNGAGYGYGPGFNGTSADAVVTVDNFKVRLCASDRSGSGLAPIINGTLTRSVVATGAELAAYGGFSASNYMEFPYSAAFDPGTGDVKIMSEVFITSAIAKQVTFIDRIAAGGGSYCRLDTDSSGKPRFTVSDGTNTATATSGSALSAGSHCLRGIRRTASSRIELEVDGVIVATATASAVGSLTNTSAVLRVGLSVAGTSPMDIAGPGIGRVHVSMSAPSADQIAFMWSTHSRQYPANSKILLAGSANVQGLAYDPDTDQLAIATAAGTNVFKGLVRTQYISVAGVADAAKLSSDNHKVAAFSGGDLVIASAAQVYGSLLATSGLREIAKKRASVPPYDPTRGIVPGLNTTSAAATDSLLALCPEGKGFEFTIDSVAVVPGGAFANRARFTTTGIITRAIGGSVDVQATTTVVYRSNAAIALSFAASSAGDGLKAVQTGLGSTTFVWTHTISTWVDVGTQQAA